MPDPTLAPWRDIVLIGGGHSHVGVLHAFARRPLPGVRLTLICTDTDTPYSGMLPGYVAGHYRFDEVHIDLRRLAAWAGARYVLDEVIGIERSARRVLCRQRPALAYDVLSINMGSTPDWRAIAGAVGQGVPVKPIRQFNQRWLALLERVRQSSGRQTIAVVGAGAGGVELTLAMQYRLRKERLAAGRDPGALKFHLFSADERILVTHNASVQRAFETVLQRRGVVVHRSAPIERVVAGTLMTRAGESLAADEIVWVTQAAGAAWLRDSGLALDERGFIQVRATLQSVSDPLIFAAGDCASLIGRPLEKAGVFAVRMGPPLAENLRRSLLQQPLRAYRPQRRWLALISTGDRQAVASRGAFYARGKLLWRWKDWIDRRFMEKFSELSEASAGRCVFGGRQTLIALDDDERRQLQAMQAQSGDEESRAIDAALWSRASSIVRSFACRAAKDEAAAQLLAMRRGSSEVRVNVSWRAFIDDPWLFGCIAAKHALSHLAARAATAGRATIRLDVPPGFKRQREEDIAQLLAGAMSIFDTSDCVLEGGDVRTGSELTVGLSMTGWSERTSAMAQAPRVMRPGERLLLSRPLGAGVLLSAAARLQARGRWVDAALATLQRTEQAAAHCLLAHGATTCEVLGEAALAEHLLALCQDSRAAVELFLDNLPLLAGATEVAAILPSEARSASASRLSLQERVAEHAAYPLLFAASIAGGLLASVPAANADACLAELQALGYVQASAIGHCLPVKDPARPIRVSIAGGWPNDSAGQH